MKKACLFLLLFAIGMAVGWGLGLRYSSHRQTDSDLALHERLVELDRSFLSNIVTRPVMTVSGSYILEESFAGQPEKKQTVELQFSGPQINKISNIFVTDLRQNGSVISFKKIEYDEGPIKEFVGIIDGNQMWGRIYVKPGLGWRQGEPPDYGVWKIIAKSK